MKPPTDSSTIRPNSCGEKPRWSCRMKGTPASMPKLMAKAKPRVSTLPRNCRSRSISPEPRSRLPRCRRSLRCLLVSRKAEQRDRQQQRAEAADEPEGRAPARPFAQKAAQGRRQRRRDVLAERDPAHDQRHLLEGVGVARHRAADHRAGSGTQSLQDAQADQPADRGREGAGEGRDGEEDQAAQQHRPAAEAVAERPVEELADGEAQHVGGERELDAVGAGAERRADRGHHRRVDAHGQRAEAAQRHQQGDVAGGTRSETHFLAASAAPSAPKSPPSCRHRHPPGARHAGIVVPERGADLVERDVGEDAAIGEILHVAPAAEIERVIDRIAGAVPVERLQAKALGQLLVEGGRRLDPASVEPDVGVAVIVEGVVPPIRSESRLVVMWLRTSA